MMLEVQDDVIMIPHLGITLRTILAAGAAKNSAERTKRRKWRLSYSGVIIGHVRVANRREEYEDLQCAN